MRYEIFIEPDSTLVFSTRIVSLVSIDPSQPAIPSRTLGTAGPVVSAIGLGCMGMSDFYGPADETKSVETIHAALDSGISLLDTGDFYGMGHNEMLLSRVLKTRRNEAFVCIKFGAVRTRDGAFTGLDLRPGAVKNFLAYSLKRLGTDYIDLYQPCRVDPKVPIEDTIGAMAEMKERGFIRYLGLSEAGPETIRRAHATHAIAALQIEYAVVTGSIEDAILPVTRELGISITAYGVFSRASAGVRRPKCRMLPKETSAACIRGLTRKKCAGTKI